jgi:hypothetical protein
MQETKQPRHIRLPQRSALVRGRIDKAAQDAELRRTATQDPNIEQNKKPKAIHAEVVLPAATAATAATPAGKSTAA